MDRRFGENDPTMTPEEKALERFTKEKQREYKKGSLFDLEDDDEEGELTHFGQSLSLDQPGAVDDFDEPDLIGPDQEDHGSVDGKYLRKRRRSSASDSSDGAKTDEDEETLPERKKTKAEVMKEVMAKSKLHKYERQQAKEDDDDLRAELDKGLPDLFALMRGHQHPPQRQPPTDAVTTMDPDRAALLNGKDRSQADKEYDERLRQMAFDKRSKPTERTRTEEEKALGEAKQLRELEAKRLRRMRGEQDSSDEEIEDNGLDLQGDEDMDQGDAETFGLGSGIPDDNVRKPLDVEDEDDFVIEDDLVASGSDVDLSEDDEDDKESGNSVSENDDDREFVQGLLSKEDLSRQEFGSASTDTKTSTYPISDNSHLAFTYPCAQSHEELLQATHNAAVSDLPTIVQRIRALYHPKLQADNKAKLGVFSAVLVDHIVYLANQASPPPFAVLESLIRHVHSLAKVYPEDIGRAFRSHLTSLHESRPLSPTPGDLIMLTAVASIFPTSDHFHPVVTPAILSMGRYLGQKLPQTLSDLANGTYFQTLCLQYQRLSKRYVPEVVNYTLHALCSLAPIRPGKLNGYFPYHEPASSLRLHTSSETVGRQLGFLDIVSQSESTAEDDTQLKIALLETQLGILDAMADLWLGKSAFYEVFGIGLRVLQHLSGKACRSKLPTSTNVSCFTYSQWYTYLFMILQDKIQRISDKLQHLIQQARLSHRPLLLHNHRPLAIKTSIPKFEESYNPDKHYDPDRDRADMSKLKAEHKRERKGALRELRKDANFIARESLREKKERDREYDKKYKRLVAEIQGEEGKEAKAYEREKRLRKGKR